MDKIKIFKIIGVVMAGIIGIIGIAFLIGSLNLSCISAPKRIENEPPICSDAKYIAYAFHRNDKVPETVISSGLASCRNQLIWNFCEKKVENVVDEMNKKRTFQECWDKNKAQ